MGNDCKWRLIHYFTIAAGYRDAECGWVMVGEENHHEDDHIKSALRTALFLVIYATKRGILEVSCLAVLMES